MSHSPGWDLYHQAKAAKSRKEAEQLWTRFVEGTSQEMRRFARWCMRQTGAQRRFGEVIEADDILFEAYGRLFAARHPVRDPRPWLCSVIRFVAFGYTKNQPGDMVSFEDYFEGSDKRASQEDRARIATPDVHEQTTDFPPMRRKLRRAVRKLPKKQRRAVIGLFYFKMTRDELARRLGVKKNSVTKLLSRATKLLGELLSKSSH